MYFTSRAAAGQTLAGQLNNKYAQKPCSVLALGDGGVVVGMQIARQLRAPLGLLLTESIDLPREPEAIAGISGRGDFTYNSSYSAGEIDDIQSEFHSLIEQEKLQKLFELHRQEGGGELVREEFLRNRAVIVVSDGMNGAFSLDMAWNFLKLIQIKRLVVATPLANVSAVDRMHILADEIYCLDVIEEFISVDHYYDTQDVPPHDLVVRVVVDLLRGWH
jgi:putative phosphoribosyl transferase